MFPVLALLFGCASLGSFQTARPLPKGAVEAAVEPSVFASYAPLGGGFIVPTAKIAVRYGVSDRVDLGLRGGLGIPEVMGRIALTDPNGDSVISLAPTVGAWKGTTRGVALLYGQGQLPLLIDLPVGEHAVILGPRLLFGVGREPDIGTWGLAILGGSSFGFAARVGPLTLLPEATVATALLGTGSGGSQVGGLAFQFGSAVILEFP